jgi:cytochrome c oxidase assembly protein subunit 15
MSTGRVLWWTAVTNLVVNIGIVVTGGAVRLTGSGLGCPTWPRCTDESYVPHGELGIHGAIEFGNRLLTFVLVVVALACWAAALRHAQVRPAGVTRPWRPFWLATWIALGIPAQAVIGGITVRTDLNPWIVAFHLLVSMAIIAACVLLLDELRGPERESAPQAYRLLVWGVLLSGWVVLWLGTVVTGSGPHSGDLHSRRTGLDPQLVSHVHAWSVYVLVALTLLAVWLARRWALARLLRVAALLLVVELAQGVIGFVQYFTDLPELLVGIHMLGAALTSAALAWLVVSAYPRAD